ncbi:MAG: hypothetical protein M1831_000703 [Alyxoria varia]|nr:MAG: hypothetical protein M1831_000703 [Alyxoria varia]
MASQQEEEMALVDDARESLSDSREDLPQRDGGAAAWRFVLGCILLEGLVWGIALTFGIFQAFYSHHPLFFESPNVAIIGTCATAMAYFGSTGLTALWLPFALEKCLQAYGFRTTLRILALMIGVVGFPATLLIQPREKKSTFRRSDIRTGCSSIVKNKTFMMFALAVFSQALGFFLPRFFLPSFAHDASLSRNQGALLLALFGFAQVVGQLSFGYISDKVNINILTLLSTSISAISALTLWGTAKSLLPLAVFPLLYGCFGGSYSVLWSRILMYLTDDDSTFATMFGVFSACRGVGNILSGPIASALLKDEIKIEEYGLNKYSNMVFFVGITMLVSSLSSVSYLWQNKIEEARLEEKYAIEEEKTKEDEEVLSRELAPLNRRARSQDEE